MMYRRKVLLSAIKRRFSSRPSGPTAIRIELINGGNADFTFKSLVIKEVSEEEFDAEQERIERLKEDSNKSKKKRRKIKNLSDEELSALTEQFKSRYSDGESLESLMPEALRLSARRITGCLERDRMMCKS